MRVIRALLGKPSRLDGFEIEVSQELKRLNPTRNVAGVLVPVEAFGISRRDLTSVSPTIQTTVADEIIPFLRVKTVCGRCGATLLDGLSGGNLLLPRATATAGAGWYGELGPIPPADQAFDSISLSPKLIAGQTIVSNQLIRQSSPDIENFIIKDISDAIAVQIDQAALFGSGSATVPKGIMSYSANAPGSFAYGLRAPSVTFGGAADWSHVLAMEKNLEDGRIFNDGTFAYVSSSNTRTKWQAAQKATNYPVYLWEQENDEMDGRVNGRRAVSSAQMTGDIVLLGKFSEMLLATWLGIDINHNSHTRAQQAETAIIVTMLVDVGFRYASAFCASTDSAAQ
jgi:HK97 family phage major capsid protein